jgi:hypothetical protein
VAQSRRRRNATTPTRMNMVVMSGQSNQANKTFIVLVPLEQAVKAPARSWTTSSTSSPQPRRPRSSGRRDPDPDFDDVDPFCGTRATKP